MGEGLVVLVAVVGVAVVGAVVVGLVVSGRRRPEGPVDGSGAMSGVFGELVEVFQPSSVHLTEELQRKRHDVQPAPDADPGPRIDLEKGVAVLRPDA
ncbi:DUF6191 domain-containing protein [Antribacter gilvus]|uniref:DUF6191 domain-containing protein n=1 Tax=Antribacter gilvus TaxID=2304675 RepID=UPI000F79937A|nr:DUF6191 domain-containing protein [Antribacter gilvus]